LVIPVLLIALAYVVGSIPIGLLVVRWLKGVDIRQYGSGNIGAVNVIRVAGGGAGAAVFVLDVAKGLLPVIAARLLDAGPWAVAAVAAMTIVGHNWSIFLGLRGGKGVATMFGAALGLSLLPTLAVVPVWLVLVALTRFSSVGSMGAACCLPVFLGLWGHPAPDILFGVLAAVMIVYRHKDNIRRLLSGRELPVNMRINAGRR